MDTCRAIAEHLLIGRNSSASYLINNSTAEKKQNNKVFQIDHDLKRTIKIPRDALLGKDEETAEMTFKSI